jgi:hypothetical protein
MTQVCTICTHPDLRAIDEAIVSGLPYRRIAALHHVTEQAIRRHKDTHLPEKILQAHNAQVRLDADQIVCIMEMLIEDARSVLTRARDQDDLRTQLLAIREVRETARTLLECSIAADIANRIKIMEQVHKDHPQEKENDHQESGKKRK